MLNKSQYVAVETLISMAINALLSYAFVYLAFHAHSVVPLHGRHGVLLDMLPQSFAIVLMGSFVPTLIARRRMLTGRLLWVDRSHVPAVRSLFLRSIASAVLAAAVIYAVSAAFLPQVLGTSVVFGHLVEGKIIFGALLALLCTPLALSRLLRHR